MRDDHQTQPRTHQPGDEFLGGDGDAAEPHPAEHHDAGDEHDHERQRRSDELGQALGEEGAFFEQSLAFHADGEPVDGARGNPQDGPDDSGGQESAGDGRQHVGEWSDVGHVRVKSPTPV